MKTTILVLAAAASLCLTCCNKRTGWSIDGNISGLSSDTKIALEANNAGHWYLVDSISVPSNGKFSYMSPEAAHYPEILRLSLPGKGAVYFPVDSLDAVSLTADAATFGTRHTLGGTEMARKVGTIDSLVSVSADIDELRRNLVPYITTDTTGIVAYYVVGKAVGSTPLFDPKEPLGNRIYGAAAQVFASHCPDDPRGLALRQAFFDGRRAMGRAVPAAGQVIEVPATGVIDIVRYDSKGVSHSLAEMAGKGNVMLLSFTDYSLPVSPAYNAVLYDAYNKYAGQGLAIYQLAFDADEVSWKEAARNLPWVTVWNAPADGASVVMQYNVGGLPLTYIIDKNGELAERVENPDNIAKALAKYF